MTKLSDDTTPAILISSSNDIGIARDLLSAQISRISGELRMEVEAFLWRESTDDGLALRSGETIQRQIDELLDGRIELTFVMFGERIGEPLGIRLPDDAKAIIDEWSKLGLTYPWPTAQDEIDAALAEGRFPLTGTVYEMFVALGMERRDQKLHLRVGYVADQRIGKDTKLGDIAFNATKLASSFTAKPGSKERDALDQEYKNQTHGIINLFQALMRSDIGLEPHLYPSEEKMAAAFGKFAGSILRKRAVKEQAEQAFKSDLTHFSLGEVMELPDRTEKRKRLHERFFGDGDAGRILFLTGPSGCGKSSLLQKGLLGELKGPLTKAIAIAVRPTDFTPRDEKTPFLKFRGLLLDLLEAEGVSNLAGLRTVQPGSTDEQLNAFVEGLYSRLSDGGHKLVLGVDQFEELLDYASLEGQVERGKPGSWWQLLRFLGKAVKQPNIWIAATLETQRTEHLKSMRLAEDDILQSVQEGVGFEAGYVKSFVMHVARAKGMPLDESVGDAVYSMVDVFEKQKIKATGGHASASFLPLLSLWMHRLYSSFRNRLVRSEDSASGAFDITTNLITPEEIMSRGLKFDLSNLVSDLVQDAWQEANSALASELSELGQFRVTNSEEFGAAVNGYASRDAGFKHLLQVCDVPAGFDIKAFFASLHDGFIAQLPGVERKPETLSEDALKSLGNFYSGLVKLDGSGNMRLTEMPRHSTVDSVQRLIESHLRRRLLEPVGDHYVRLVHQAVIDNWLPGKIWYETRNELFKRRRRLEAFAGDDLGGHEKARQELLPDAMHVLSGMQAIWSVSDRDSLADDDLRLMDFCLEIISADRTGKQVFEFDGRESSLLSIAACYGQDDVVDTWLNAAKSKGFLSKLFKGQDDLVNRQFEPQGTTALLSAAWSSQASVEVLLRHGAIHDLPDKQQWHPIAGAIQAGRVGIMQTLLQQYETGNPVIGPDGITVAHEAARSTKTEPLENLIKDLSAPLPASLEHKMTPLHFAAGAGRVEQVEMLIPFGNVAARDKNAMNCLDHAVWGDHGKTIQTILNSEHLSDDDRAALLCGDETTDGKKAVSPLAVSAAVAAPNAMAALLEHCPDPTAQTHNTKDRTLLENLLFTHNKPSISGSEHDRVMECVKLLLSNEKIIRTSLMKAHSFTQFLPEAARLIENKIILEGDLSGMEPGFILAFATGKRLRVAKAAIKKRPDVLDHDVGNGITGAQVLLRDASPAILSDLLRRRTLPNLSDPGLFSLQASLRILKDYKEKHAGRTDDMQADPRDAFLGINRSALHPLILGYLDDPTAEDVPALIEIGGEDGAIAPFLHRLAIRDEAELFEKILTDMTFPLPRDQFARLPSELASSRSRQKFAALEENYNPRRTIQ